MKSKTPKPKTYRDAAKDLPEDCRDDFQRAFKAANVMDLYEGDLKSYMNVIASELERRSRDLQKARGTITAARKVLDMEM